MTTDRNSSVALVLGGGAARGFAHIGVLRALEEARLVPDRIVACSMGGLVGALAASGHGADEIRDLADRYLSPRVLAPGRYGSFLGSRGIGELLRQHVRESFEDLDVPLAVTTVDIQRGELVVLDRGKLAPALLATIAIPGVLQPVEIDGRMLVDGGLLNNLPVDLIPEESSSPVVAVDVSEPADRTIDLRSPSLWRQIVAALRPGRRPLTAELFLKIYLVPLAEITRLRLEKHPPDVLVRPEFRGDLLMEDLLRKDEAVDAGYEAGRRALRELSSGD